MCVRRPPHFVLRRLNRRGLCRNGRRQFRCRSHADRFPNSRAGSARLPHTAQQLLRFFPQLLRHSGVDIGGKEFRKNFFPLIGSRQQQTAKFSCGKQHNLAKLFRTETDQLRNRLRHMAITERTQLFPSASVSNSSVLLPKSRVPVPQAGDRLARLANHAIILVAERKIQSDFRQ